MQRKQITNYRRIKDRKEKTKVAQKKKKA